MTLYSDKLSITKQWTLKMIESAWMRKKTSPRETVVALLNSVNMQPKFSNVDGEYPICL